MQSKGLPMHRNLIVLVASGLCMLTFTACSAEYRWDGGIDAYPCLDKTYSDYRAKGCVDYRCTHGHAIPEDNCAVDGDSSARCTGTCVPNAPNGFVDPQPVYIGPNNGTYASGCPTELGEFGGIQYFGLNALSFGCPVCTCGAPEGTCAPPTTISARAGMCNDPQATTVDFSGPANWDGSCTNANAIPGGAECPLGSGILCVQSIESATMPSPVEACAPIPIPVPKAGSDVPWWTDIVLSCSANEAPQSCVNATAEKCLPSLPGNDPNWTYCVRSEITGVHACPSGWGSKYTQQVLGYNDYVDTRSCTECACEPMGSVCYGTLRLYNDDACSTNELKSSTLSSTMNTCENVQPAGESLGSKEFTDLFYVPGTCLPSGGEPFGVAQPDEMTVVTWCCISHAS